MADGASPWRGHVAFGTYLPTSPLVRVRDTTRALGARAQADGDVPGLRAGPRPVIPRRASGMDDVQGSTRAQRLHGRPLPRLRGPYRGRGLPSRSRRSPATNELIAARNLFHPDRAQPKNSDALAALPPTTNLMLYGVVWSEENPIAYVEDPSTKKIFGYKRGDAMAGGYVDRIEPDRIVIQRTGGPVEILLRAPNKPRPVAAATPAPENATTLSPSDAFAATTRADSRWSVAGDSPRHRAKEPRLALLIAEVERRQRVELGARHHVGDLHAEVPPAHADAGAIRDRRNPHLVEAVDVAPHAGERR